MYALALAVVLSQPVTYWEADIQNGGYWLILNGDIDGKCVPAVNGAWVYWSYTDRKWHLNAPVPYPARRANWFHAAPQAVKC